MKRYEDLGTIVVEVDIKRNRQLGFSSLLMKLRGKFSLTKLAGKDFGTKGSMLPDIPGHMIEFSPGRRRIRVFDPLATEEYAEQFEAIKDALKRARNQEFKATPETLRENLDDNDLKTILFEFANLRRGRKIRVLSGEIPLPEEVEHYPGRRRLSPYDNSQTAPRLEPEKLATGLVSTS